MKHLLLALSAFTCISFNACAQSIVAGQTSGVLYTDISPDRVTSAVLSSNTPLNTPVTVADSLDLDLDGRYDLKWTAHVAQWLQSGRGSTFEQLFMQPLHTDIEVATFSGPPHLITGFDSQNVIQATLPTLPPHLGNIWRNSTNWNNELALVRMGTNPGGNFNFSTWPLSQDRYMGIRLRTSTSAPWMYGWVNVQVTSPGVNLSIVATVKDYAFEQNVLSNKTTAANNTWQIYPNPVERVLALQSKPLGSGQAKLFDVQGRVVLATPLSALGKQDLDFSLLPAGVYILHLTTAQGTVTKRINKL